VKNAQKKKRHDSDKISSVQADSLSVGDKESKQSSEHHDDTPNEEVIWTEAYNCLSGPHLTGLARSENVKEGVGYNAVPPPAADLYLSPKKDLSWTGLPKFVDDTVTDY
nr:lupus la protein [Tanacetum cinerariifolium]